MGDWPLAFLGLPTCSLNYSWISWEPLELTWMIDRHAKNCRVLSGCYKAVLGVKSKIHSMMRGRHWMQNRDKHIPWHMANGNYIQKSARWFDVLELEHLDKAMKSERVDDWRTLTTCYSRCRITASCIHLCFSLQPCCWLADGQKTVWVHKSLEPRSAKLTFNSWFACMGDIKHEPHWRIPPKHHYMGQAQSFHEWQGRQTEAHMKIVQEPDRRRSCDSGQWRGLRATLRMFSLDGGTKDWTGTLKTLAGPTRGLHSVTEVTTYQLVCAPQWHPKHLTRP